MYHQKRERILMLLVLIGSASFLVHCCGALEQQQNSTVIEPINITSQSSGHNTTSPSAPDQKTFVYLSKTDYQSGEPIEISGSTTLPAGTHLYITIATLRWHSKTKPEGKTTYLSKEILVQNPTNGTDRNFFINFNSTVLIPGDYYIEVLNLDGRQDEEAMLNRTSFPFTIDKSLIPTQSGVPLAVTALMTMIAVSFITIWREKRD